MKRDRRSRGARRKYRCLSTTVRRGLPGHEGREHTDDIDICTSSSTVIVLVLKVQVGITGSAQLLLRGDPSKTPGSVVPAKNRSEFDQLPRIKGTTH